MEGMFNGSHKNLDVWNFGRELIKDIYKVTKTFPVDERYALTSQLKRASVSIPVNIAEGAARQSPKEYIQFLRIELGSASEIDTLLIVAYDLEFIDKQVQAELSKKVERIGMMLIGLIKRKSK